MIAPLSPTLRRWGQEYIGCLGIAGREILAWVQVIPHYRNQALQRRGEALKCKILVNNLP